MALQNLRSNTANKRPTASGMVDGQVAINTNATNPGLFFKDAGDGIRKVGPVFIGSSAPNSSPAAGGSSGHSIGEQWLDTSNSRYVLKTWDGTAWRDDDSNYLQLTGGALSGALTIDNAANVAALDLKFDGDTDTGFYAPAANTLGFVGGGTERVRIDSSGRVGIGITAPGTTLTVQQSGNGAIAQFRDASNYDGQLLINTDGTFTVNGRNNVRFSRTGSDTESARIDSSGNVAIGTSSPVANTPLTLQGPSGYTDTLWLKSTGTNIDSRINFGPTGTGSAQINNATGTDIAFQVSGSEKLRIDSSGNVGIAALGQQASYTDYAKAVVFGTSSETTLGLVFRTGTSGTSSIAFADNSGSGSGAQDGLIEYSQTNRALAFSTAASERLRIDSSGRIEYSHNTYLTAKDSAGSGYVELLKANASNQTVIANNKNAGIVFVNTNTSELARIDSSGNVGIGTTSPDQKLHIVGNYKGVNSSGQGVQIVNTTTPYIQSLGTSTVNDLMVSSKTFRVETGTSYSTSERLRIDSSGNVGIGTASPTSTASAGPTLEISGTAGGNLVLSDSNATSGQRAKYFLSQGGSLYVGHSADNGTSPVNDLVIDSSGRLLVGATSSYASANADDLQVGDNTDSAQSGITLGSTVASSIRWRDGADAGIILYLHDDNSMRFSTADSERLRIDGSGRVLIGTTSNFGSGSGGDLFQVASGSGGHVLLGRDASTVAAGQNMGMIRAYSNGGSTYGESSRIQFSADANHTSSNKAGRITFSTSSTSALTERMRIDSSGNVGIGTTTPESRLEISRSTADDNTDLRIKNYRPGIRFVDISSDSADGEIVMDGGSMRFRVSEEANASTALTERIRIDSSGNVGIGTTSPSSYGGAVKLATVSASNTALSIASGTSSDGTLFFADGTSGDATYRGSVKYSHSSDAMQFSTAASEQMRIDSSGNVGIGVTNPGSFNAKAETLVLAKGGDHVGITLDCNTDKEGSIYFADGASGDNLLRGQIVYNHSGDSLRFVTNASERMRIDSSGNVGIGASSPSAKLDVAGNQLFSAANPQIQFNAGGPIIRLPSANTLAFLTDSTNERMRIDSSGRLLIGATSTRNSWNNSTIGANILQIERAGDANAAALSITANSGTTNNSSALSAAARVILGRSRGTSVGSNTLVGNGDVLGDISFQGNDGSGFVEAAAIQAFVDNPPGSNDMPGRLVFSTTADGTSSPNEKMRIFHTGQTHHFSTVNGLFVGSSQSAGTTNWLYRGNRNRTSNTAGGTSVFYVYTNGNVQNTNNSYTAISDVKLKENIVDATSQWDDVKAIQVRKYNFIEGETHTQLGVIAQEVETVSPGLVFETTDRDEEGNDLGTVTKGVNYSVLYMKAVKALQEAMERIETLETKVAALEAE